MKFRFLPEASDELKNATEYYEACQEELGLDFLIEFDRTVRRIVEYPQAW